MHDRKPVPGELCVVSQRKMWKRDALLFDRVHVADWEFRWENIPPAITFGIHEIDNAINLESPYAQIHAWEEKYPGVFGVVQFGYPTTEETEPYYRREISKAYRRVYSVEVIASYESNRNFLKEFPNGHRTLIEAALNNLPILNDQNVTWDEIISFREDHESVQKVRNLRLWLTNGIKVSSLQEATDVIAQKVEGYERALKKHGLKTITGSFLTMDRYFRAIFRLKNMAL